MKVKATTFEAQNLQTARVILQNQARFGPASLLVRWARAVAGKARVDSGPEQEGQQKLFETEAA